ncbi:MAG: hypothetical protein QM681_11740 [Novosphingobium sp.]
MSSSDTTLERAFELARSGQFRTIKELRQQLTKEGCLDVTSHTEGLSIKKQLGQLMRDSIQNGAAG